MKVKVGKYYLVSLKHLISIPSRYEKLPCKCIRIGGAPISSINNCIGFEFFIDLSSIYQSYKHDCRGSGKLGYCLWLFEEDVIRELTPDEAMVEGL